MAAVVDVSITRLAATAPAEFTTLSLVPSMSRDKSKSNPSSPGDDGNPTPDPRKNWKESIARFKTAAHMTEGDRQKRKMELGKPVPHANPNLPAFADALMARNADLPPSTSSASAATVDRGVAFWDLGWPFWNPQAFYQLVMSELDPFAQTVIMQTDVKTLGDFLEILAIVAPNHSLPLLWEAANQD